MKKSLWALLLLASCEPPLSETGAPRSEVVRQALPPALGGGVVLGRTLGMAMDKFGHALAYGDFNNDQKIDLAVGAPGALGEGRVYVYYGPINSAGAATTGVELGPPGLPLANANSRFGATLAAADVDNDGITDLVVGAPDLKEMLLPAGIVFVFSGSTGNGLGAPRPLDGRLLVLGARARFGTALAAEPGRIYVGAPGAFDGGAVLTFVSNGTQGFQLEDTFAGQTNEELGIALLPMQIDGAGRTDLIAGGRVSGFGRTVTFIHNATLGRWDQGIRQALPGRVTEGFEMAKLGVGMSIAIGMPAASTNAGELQMTYVTSTGSLTSSSTLSGGTNEQLGRALAVSDLDGDGTGELYAGGPGRDLVHIFALPLADAGYLASPMTATSFGSALAGGVDLIDDEAQDLVIGAEDYNDGLSLTVGGAVFIIPGALAAAMDGGPSVIDGGPLPMDAGVTPGDGGVVPQPLVVSIRFTDGPDHTVEVTPIVDSGNAADFYWDFGDLSPIAHSQRLEQVTHQYAIPGGYVIRLRAGGGPPNAYQTAFAEQQVRIADRFGNLPPTAQIKQLSSMTQGPGVTHTLECATNAPPERIRWDLSDEGPLREGSMVTVTAIAGAVRVHCWVENDDGLFAHDSVLVRSGMADISCRLALSPPAGEAPLATTLIPEIPAPDRATLVLKRGDGVSINDPAGTSSFDEGFTPVTLSIGVAVRCTDRVRVFAYQKPEIVSVPPPVKCGEQLSYVVDARGGELSLVTGEGVTFDHKAATVRSEPVFESTKLSFELKVSNTFAETRQVQTMTVPCSPNLGRFTTCGCSGSGMGLGLGLALLCFTRRRRR